MYNNESYEEYIRSILGYPNYNNSHFENDNYNSLEEYYPEIYKTVYPMVTKSCLNNTRPITEEVINELTEEIYKSVEPNTNLPNQTNQTRNSNANNGLKDLIKILLIRELLGNRPNRPGRILKFYKK